MDYQIAILTTTINEDVISVMLKSATDEASKHNVNIIQIGATTGCLDMPIIAQQLLTKNNIQGLIVLGAVAQGETKHDELVVNTMTTAIVDLSIKHNKPVGFGVIGPGASREAFMPRADEYARRAVQAVITNLDLINDLTTKNTAD